MAIKVAKKGKWKIVCKKCSSELEGGPKDITVDAEGDKWIICPECDNANAI